MGCVKWMDHWWSRCHCRLHNVPRSHLKPLAMPFYTKCHQPSHSQPKLHLTHHQQCSQCVTVTTEMESLALSPICRPCKHTQMSANGRWGEQKLPGAVHLWWYWFTSSQLWEQCPRSHWIHEGYKPVVIWVYGRWQGLPILLSRDWREKVPYLLSSRNPHYLPLVSPLQPTSHWMGSTWNWTQSPQLHQLTHLVPANWS